MRLLLQFVFGLYGDPWSYRFFPSELALFLAGALGYKVYSAASPEHRNAVMRMFVASTLTIAVALLVNRWNGIPRVGSVAFLTAAVLSIPFLFKLTRNWRWDTYVGNLSYPVYIIHILIAHLAASSLPLYVAAVLAASVLAHHLVDAPIDAWRHRKSRQLGSVA